MVNTLALLLSSEERQRSRYAVETLSNDSDLYDSDLFVQGMLKVLPAILINFLISKVCTHSVFTLFFDSLHACVKL